MNREYDNVEIINFESITNNDENDVILDNDDIAMEYLTNFLIEKFDHEENHPLENITINDNQSLMSSFYSASTAMKSSDNLSTSRCYEPIISEKEKILTPYEFKPEVKNEKPFQCDYDNCKKNFKYKWILDRHLISHKTIKLFICNHIGCEKSYKSKENLTLHIKNIHLKEKPYSCSYCPSLFSHRNGKTYHERKFHTNYLPHKCNKEGCTSTFASKSALSYHFKSHCNKKEAKTINVSSNFNNVILNF